MRRTAEHRPGTEHPSEEIAAGKANGGCGACCYAIAAAARLSNLELPAQLGALVPLCLGLFLQLAKRLSQVI